MMHENRIKKVFSEYLGSQGYDFSEDNLLELVEIYLDCQEWDDENLLNGMTEVEMYDWVKHTSEVSRIIAESERSIDIRKMILAYMDIKTLCGMEHKDSFEIDIASRI